MFGGFTDNFANEMVATDFGEPKIPKNMLQSLQVAQSKGGHLRPHDVIMAALCLLPQQRLLNEPTGPSATKYGHAPFQRAPMS
jgi:hypothetical protein